jgi:hypothetical protein
MRCGVEAMIKGITATIVSVLIVNPVMAESPSSAMEKFELVGTWSENCARDLSQSCEFRFDSKTYVCGSTPVAALPSRVTYETSLLSGATRTTQTASLSKEVKGPIIDPWIVSAASRITADKIKLTVTYDGEDRYKAFDDRRQPWMNKRGNAWNIVYQREGDKIRTLDLVRTDDSWIYARDGFRYGATGTNNVWEFRKSDVQSPLLERCLN